MKIIKKKKWIEGKIYRDGFKPGLIMFVPTKPQFDFIKGKNFWIWGQIPEPWYGEEVVWKMDSEVFFDHYNAPWLKPGTKHLIDLEI